MNTKHYALLFTFALVFWTGINWILLRPETIEGKVVTVTKSEWPWKHTRVYFATYGEDTITGVYSGYLELEIGETYRIFSKGTVLRQLYPTAISIEKLQSSSRSET